MKLDLKAKSIELRTKGLSYSEIQKYVPVSRASLSLWLKPIKLSKKQKRHLKEKQTLSALKGAQARKNQRIALTEKIISESKKQIGPISLRELWLLGIMLYWAEGSKEKDNNIGLGVQFSNSDPKMIRLFLKWLVEICGVDKKDIYFDIFIHENSKNNLDKVMDYWSRSTGFSKIHFPHIYFKKNKIKTNRKNVGDSYFGLVKLRVKASSNLNRKIAGWTQGVIESCNN